MKPITTLATCRTPEGVPLTLIHHDRDHFLMLGGVQLMSTNACSSEQLMAELACAAGLRAGARVLIGGLGFGFTLRRVLELVGPLAQVEVAELLPEIIAWNREFLGEVNGRLLEDARVALRQEDVYDLLQVEGEARFDAILLDVDNSPDPLVQQGNARLYGKAGLSRVREALRPGGRVVFWSANRDAGFADLLRRAFARVECVSAKAYPKAKRSSHTLFVADREG